MTPVAAPPSAFQRQPGKAPKPAPIPFEGIFRAFADADAPQVQAAIDALVLARRSVSVLRVREHIDGVLPATERPPTSPRPEPLPPIVVTVVNVPGAQSDEDCQAQSLLRVAAACTPKADRLTVKLVRCFGRPPPTAVEEARYQADMSRAYRFKNGRTERLVQDFGYLPSANAYETAETRQVRVAELFAPYAGGCE